MLFCAMRGNMLFIQAPTDEQIMDLVSAEMVLFLLITSKYIDNFFFLFSLFQSAFIIVSYHVPNWFIFPLMYSLSA